jgi:hypothetical protein
MPVRRCVIAAIPLGLLIALYGTFLASSNLIPVRAMAATTLLGTGTLTLLLTDEHDPPGIAWLTPVLAVPATVCAALAPVLAPKLLLTVAIATVLTLWTLQLAEHITFQARTGEAERAAGYRPGSRTG